MIKSQTGGSEFYMTAIQGCSSPRVRFARSLNCSNSSPRASRTPRRLARTRLLSSCQAALRGQGRSPDLAKATRKKVASGVTQQAAGASCAYGPARAAAAAGPAFRKRSGHGDALAARSPSSLSSIPADAASRGWLRGLAVTRERAKRQKQKNALVALPKAPW